MHRTTAIAFRSLFAATTLLTTVAAQAASYDPYGTGCPGTGTGMGQNHVAPLAAATTFQPSNNVMGLSGGPQRYQQVFTASEFPTAFTMCAVALPWDNQTYLQMPGATVDLEINIGFTTRTPTTLSTTFAANWDLGAPTQVLPRSNVVYPDFNNPPAVDPTQFQLVIPWTTTFAWAPQPGRNLLIEFVQRGSSQGPGWNYVLDCGWSSSTARLYGTATSATGSLDGFGYGYAMAFKELTTTAVPILAGGDTPQFGNDVPIRLSQARASTIALMITGMSNTTWNGLPLPLGLAPAGAPGCALRASYDFGDPLLTDAQGRATYILHIPMDFGLLGLPVYQQFAIYDPTANAFGFAFSNAGVAVIGN